MNKERSIQIKGVAIIMMLYAHLFVRSCDWQLIQDLMIDGKPLSSMFCPIMCPVYIFLILSGYGLYIKNLCGWDKNKFRRIFLLYRKYWITLAFYVPIGFLMGIKGYPGDILTIIENVTAFHTTYNYELWFLFPFVLVSLLAPFFFKIVQHSRILSVGIIAVTRIIDILIAHFIGYHEVMMYSYAIYDLYMILHFIAPFIVGMLFAYYAENGAFSQKVCNIISKNRLLMGGGIVCLLVVRCLFSRYFDVLIFSSILVLFLMFVRLDNKMGRVLSVLGKYSTYMWMIHTYFCYYFFQELIYSPKYPVLIFVFLILVSLLGACFLSRIEKFVFKHF
ncbi:MAG: acyltransferase [Bacteroidales bacterium]|nr:acyltransferase [Bacteroidales bacterium]